MVSAKTPKEAEEKRQVPLLFLKLYQRVNDVKIELLILYLFIPAMF